MARRDLPDIYALAQGLQVLGHGHIYQAKIPTGHGISNTYMYHLSVLTKTCIGSFGSLYKRPYEF